jgi:hypothetical protein
MVEWRFYSGIYLERLGKARETCVMIPDVQFYAIA